MPTEGNKVLQKLAEIKDLPTIPEIVIKIINLIKKPDVGIADITRYIEEDPVITAKVLQVANSPLFRGAQEITSLSYAASRLGLNEIEKILLTLSLMKGIKGMTKEETRLFWRHSISVALMCNVVNEFSNKPFTKSDPARNDLFVGGLLHDIGLLVLKHHFTSEYEQVIMVCEAGDASLIEAEYEMMGTTHSEIGATLAKNWNIPNSVIAMIAFHHEPEKAPEESLQLAQIVNIADFICNNQGLGFSGELNVSKFSETAWWQLGMEIEKVPEMLEEVKKKSQESAILTTIGL